MMEDNEPLIKIVTWFLLVVSGLATAGRLTIKWSMAKKFNMDDGCAVIALALNVGAGVALSIAANDGLGHINATPSPAKARAIEKDLYATGILFILTVAFAKLSIIFLLRHLFVDENHQRWILVLGVFIGLQGFSQAMAAVLPCDAPSVWALASDRCFDLVAFWRSVGILHIVTDLALVMLPILMIHNIQMPIGKKAIVASCFGVRVMQVNFVLESTLGIANDHRDIAACATQLAYTKDFASSDFFAGVWPWYFIAQVTQTCTIVSSSVPYLRQLLQTFPSGMFQTDEMRRRGLNHSDFVHGFAMSADRTYVLKDVESISNRSQDERAASQISMFATGGMSVSNSSKALHSQDPSEQGFQEQGDSGIHVSRSFNISTEPVSRRDPEHDE